MSSVNKKDLYDLFNDYEKKKALESMKESYNGINKNYDIMKKLSETINSKDFKKEYQYEFYEDPFINKPYNTKTYNINFGSESIPSTTAYAGQPISIPQMIKEVDKIDKQFESIENGWSSISSIAEKELGHNVVGKIAEDLKKVNPLQLSQQKAQELESLLNAKIKQLQDAIKKEKENKVNEVVDPVSRFDLLDI